ncbi:TPA: hypothetical protein ACH3X1_004442 [Trebouxia sp. C0004]
MSLSSRWSPGVVSQVLLDSDHLNIHLAELALQVSQQYVSSRSVPLQASCFCSWSDLRGAACKAHMAVSNDHHLWPLDMYSMSWLCNRLLWGLLKQITVKTVLQ